MMYFWCARIFLETFSLSRVKIDRKNVYRHQDQGFFFPHYENRTMPMRDCILDGELVLDNVPGTGNVRSFIAFFI